VSENKEDSSMAEEKRTKPVGSTKDVGYEFGLRRTFAISVSEAWQFLISEEGVRLWLGEVDDFRLEKGATFRTVNNETGTVRVVNPQTNIRLTWPPVGWEKPSTIQVRVIPAGAKTTISFHQENLPGPAEREQMRLRWEKVMQQIENRLFQ
jgi:uncharacterized protein YndB with AHSA1/START domain